MASADQTLNPYFQALQLTPLLSRREEQALAGEIDRLIIAHWRALLSYGRALPHVAKVIEAHLPDRPRVLAALRPRHGSASARSRSAALTRAAMRLRRLDSSGLILREARAAVVSAFAGDPKAGGFLQRVARAHAAEQAAKQRFVTANLRLVIAMARRHGHSMLSLADLIQEGNFGLMRAVESFDHRRGYRFSTYATWWIRQAIRRALADRGRLVRVPVHALEDIARIQRTSGSFAALTGSAPDLAELAAQTGLAPSKLALLGTPGLLKTPLSLDHSYEDESERTLLDMLASDGERAADELVELEGWHRSLERLFARLTPMEASTLRLRYGLEGPELTLREIGDRYGLSRERIRQIQMEALGKLRAALSDDPSDDDDGTDGLAA